ncbi:MAG TPA: glucose-6-phosphate dehydrogenase, partial [Chromatiales bacterium]|nr:glucose-6-phosphate dehydrogenase [Chromatiales bacterium]
MVRPAPCYFVIFGATGNLATDKLLPALYHLEAAERIHDELRFLALARRDWSQDDWRMHLDTTLRDRLGAQYDPETCLRLAARFEYVRGNYREPAAYQSLLEVLSRPREGTCENIVFYLAIRPADFLDVVTRLHETGFSGSFAQHRIVVEKPFGEDIDSAKALNL